VRWVARFKAKGEISPAPTGGDRRSGRIEAHRDYLLGLIRRRPDMTLLEIQECLIANCGERFSSSVLWRFFDRHEITFKKSRPRPACGVRNGVAILTVGEGAADGFLVVVTPSKNVAHGLLRT
jgi:transposase